jgi:hypothetical protein
VSIPLVTHPAVELLFQKSGHILAGIIARHLAEKDEVYRLPALKKVINSIVSSPLKRAEKSDA